MTEPKPIPTTTVRHVLTFEGDVPRDEIDRAAVLGHPDVATARRALLDAFASAGARHVASSRVVHPKAVPITAAPATTASGLPIAGPSSPTVTLGAPRVVA